MQLCFFAIAYTLKMDKVTDFAGTSNFIVLAAFTLWLGNDFSLPKMLATLMVCLWGFRLGGYLFYRILIWGEDHRFDKMREVFWSFLGFWVYQMLWVFLLSLPVTYFNGMTGNFELTNLSYFGLVMFSIGFVIESMADYGVDESRDYFMGDEGYARQMFQHYNMEGNEEKALLITFSEQDRTGMCVKE